MRASGLRPAGANIAFNLAKTLVSHEGREHAKQFLEIGLKPLSEVQKRSHGLDERRDTQ